jgi:hypothetical protein
VSLGGGGGSVVVTGDGESDVMVEAACEQRYRGAATVNSAAR